MKNYSWMIGLATVFLFSCTSARKVAHTRTATVEAPVPKADGFIRSTIRLKGSVPEVTINTGNVSPATLISFAMRQIGVPYLYGGTDRRKGFDCSGFINYVFDNFKIKVPRTSVMFTNAGVDIPIEFSKPGDLILFTGTNPRSGVVGHMGIITKNVGGNIEFIHASTSRGVMVSGLNSYFIPRFVRVNRIFIPSSVRR